MRVVTSREMREIDSWAMEKLGIPGLVLMENAGRGIVNTIRRIFGDPSEFRVAIICGKGNNGGDGFVVARHLLNSGASVKVFLLGRVNEAKGDAKVNLNIALKMGIRLEEITQESVLPKVKRGLRGCSLIVDGIFGTGFEGTANGIPAKAIKLINDSRLPVISIDAPSGLNSDNGAVDGPCVKASLTGTMGLPKRGLFLYPGRDFVGDLWLLDIGTPLPEPRGPGVELVEKQRVAELIPPRPPSGHKGSFGEILVVAGSRGMSGAAALTSLSALKAGAGLVYLALPESLNPSMEAALTEVITIPLPETESGSLSLDGLGRLDDILRIVDVLALGPGLSTEKETEELVTKLIPKLRIPTVIDADGLNNIARNLKLLKRAKAPLVITPHPGELSRLIGKTIPQIERDRIGFARRTAKELKQVLLLKGVPTVAAEPTGFAYLNPTGNSALATAGSGDVLTGVIAGMLAQGLSPLGSGIVGAYLHGLAGDLAARELTPYGVLAGDVMDMIPEAIGEVLEGEEDDHDQPILSAGV